MTSSVAPIVVGCFGKAFGILGWIKVNSFATPKESILDFKPWLIQKNNVWEEFYFENSRKHAGKIIIKLPNCSSPEEARLFTNIKIAVLREQFLKLNASEYYWEDLVGLKVINKEVIDFGVVQSIMATGSNDVLVVVGERKRLIPYTSNVIFEVDLAGKIIKVDWEKDF